MEAGKGGIFRCEDGGETWELASGSHALRQRAWYYSTMAVNPVNPNEVWFPQVPMLKTIDGGRTIDYVRGLPHGDNHDLWIDPADPKRMIVANAGRPHISRNSRARRVTPPRAISPFRQGSRDAQRPQPH